MTIEPLRSDAHLHHGWKRHTDMKFAAHDAWVPVRLSELRAVLPHYALAVQRQESGEDQLVALLSLQEGQNYYLSPEGKWIVPYVPSFYRGYPFRLGQVTVKEEVRQILCFDHGSGLYREQPNIEDQELLEERFFQDDGQLTTMTSRLVAFLTQCLKDEQQTAGAIDALIRLDLLKDWDIDQACPGGSVDLSGMRQVKQEGLRSLGAEDLAQLERCGALEIAYALYFSSQKLRFLEAIQQARSPKEVAPAADDVLDFGMDFLTSE